MTIVVVYGGKIMKIKMRSKDLEQTLNKLNLTDDEREAILSKANKRQVKIRLVRRRSATHKSAAMIAAETITNLGRSS